MAQTRAIPLLAALCLLCISKVLANSCAPYVDEKLKLVPYQDCGDIFTCGGTCTNRYCILLGQLDQTHISCLVNNLYVIIGVSIVILLSVVGGIVACCCKCCCFACSLCSRDSII
ncbi:protein shisa-4-like [Eleutherodactylus coqui]|uniref:Shisa N-terminal domain-containing protein n=1 Tax=Eleutherodactylus coqui TaxID=57060 RepID=A0A8J6EJS0_ELECQ|nr:hypothetical protein GDO78_018168 [Eleutherodactylus coqui]